MSEIECKNWNEFKSHLTRYAAQSPERRNELWFRGLGNFHWQLNSTLDRWYGHLFVDDRYRNNKASELVDAFINECQVIGGVDLVTDEKEVEAELIARHHGLPSPLIDWTRSPYVAAYFAYSQWDEKSDKICIWVLDRAKLEPIPTEDYELIEQPDLIIKNKRAIQQRGVFLRINTMRSLLEVLGNKVFTKFVLPIDGHELQSAMSDLDEMLINSTNMLYDLSGVAKTAALRVLR